MKKTRNITFHYGLIFLFTGILIFIYSKIIFNYTEDINIGERFKTKGFFESDLFSIIGIVQCFIGFLYLLIHLKGKFYLIDKATIRSYWFTIPFILSILMIPVLDKYYPTSKYGDTFLTKIIDYYSILSTFLFLAGVYYFSYNFIKSIYAYHKIKTKWK
tara:strand:+ start:59 stop:535 length:477 start_codon:yes stop_codon:yes gene_type:complete